jgi:hypothetical protein
LAKWSLSRIIADTAALEFATFLRTIALRFLGGGGKWGTREEITVSGTIWNGGRTTIVSGVAAGPQTALPRVVTSRSGSIQTMRGMP